jgi:hypothetical protein
LSIALVWQIVISVDDWAAATPAAIRKRKEETGLTMVL